MRKWQIMKFKFDYILIALKVRKTHSKVSNIIKWSLLRKKIFINQSRWNLELTWF